MEEEVVAPVTEVAPEAATHQQEVTADLVEESKPEVKPERTFTQKELDEILQKRLAKESRKIERYSRAEAELRLLKEQMQPKQEPANLGEPKREQFQDYESYIDALTDFKVEQKLKGHQERSAQESQMRAQREHEEILAANISKAADKYDDFNDVVTNRNLPITFAMRDAMGESELGGDIAYYLGSNVQEAAQIARLSPIAQVKAILALEAKLRTPKKVTTDAPEPIKPSGGNAKVTKSPADMTDKEFSEWRKKHINSR